MEKIVFKIFGKPVSKDKGVRGTTSGRLYIDKEVFFKRKEVKQAISDIYSSKTVKQHIKIANS